MKVGELPPVQADPALLRQVFVNLLSNAVKFSTTRPRRTIEVLGRREAGQVVYEVADNGVGFDMRYAGKLFGVFQRLHGREFEGTGVGLALVERIVARHGGTIRATAELDRGARFTISFPDGGATA
ncbi:MAG: GHKL domain-containing protein [Deltaproteobacteria bacterium]|nr:GHKL domain-containing protein [Deltaproteobacteria bacterium]